MRAYNIFFNIVYFYTIPMGGCSHVERRLIKQFTIIIMQFIGNGGQIIHFKNLSSITDSLITKIFYMTNYPLCY